MNGFSSSRQALTRPYELFKAKVRSLDKHYRLRDRYKFDDRRAGSSTLVCMLAGYKPELWHLVFPRFEAALPEADICIMTAGKFSEELSALCRDKNWSYLSTATNDVSLTQNVCYSLHDRARMIVKVDEDMFLRPDTIRTLLSEYASIKREGVYDPGFVSPTIPLNGFCYRFVLETFGLLEEYERLFGTARLATAGIPIQNDPAAARWIWERTGPLAVTAERLAALDVQRLACPIQFSIGLIAFERAYWETIGYFKVPRHLLLAGITTLGADETYLCAQGLNLSRPGVVTTAAVAGHFSFGPQSAGQKQLLRERPDLFS